MKEKGMRATQADSLDLHDNVPRRSVNDADAVVGAAHRVGRSLLVESDRRDGGTQAGNENSAVGVQTPENQHFLRARTHDQSCNNNNNNNKKALKQRGRTS